MARAASQCTEGRGQERASLNRLLPPLGEIRGRRFQQQRYRASGLNLLPAAIGLWNTVYLHRAVQTLRAHGQPWAKHCCPLYHHWVGSTLT
jgi:TnpA family transposase